MKKNLMSKLLALLLCLVIFRAEAQLTAASYTSTLTGDVINYLYYLPQNYNPALQYPVIVTMHGHGDKANWGIDKLRTVGIGRAITNGLQLPFIVISPQTPYANFDVIGNNNQNRPGQMITEALDIAISRYNADPARAYNTGFSMSGVSVYNALAYFPDRYAAGINIASWPPVYQEAPKVKAPVWENKKKNDPDGGQPYGNIEFLNQTPNTNDRYTIINASGHFLWNEVHDNSWTGFSVAPEFPGSTPPSSIYTWLQQFSTGPVTPPTGGLRGEYFTNKDLLGTPALTRTDAVIDFNWGDNAPASGIGQDLFSVRWTGSVTATTTGSYTFYTQSDDGIRLSVNGQSLINNFTNHGSTEDVGSISLTAGQQYRVELEYFENAGGAIAQLSWTTPGNSSKQIIPSSQLSPVLVPVVPQNNNGLNAEYFNTANLTGTSVTRKDPNINFTWAANPIDGIGQDNFSVRWTGFLEAQTTGSYIFTTNSDDGIRLFVNNLPAVTNWTDHGAIEDHSDPINLVAGQRYPITLEFYEKTGGAAAQLYWTLPNTTTKQIIPSSQLFPSSTNTGTGNGDGLNAAYYSTLNLTGTPVTKTDQTVNFQWVENAPFAGFPSDNYSVRWTGFVKANQSAKYTFYTRSDDGVRLWVNNRLLVDNWTDHGAIYNSDTITLSAGIKYAIKLEYYEKVGGAVAELHWSTPTLSQQIIPQANLYTTNSSPRQGSVAEAEVENKIMLYPVPAKSEVNLSLTSPVDENVTLRIFDEKSMEVLQLPVMLHKGVNHLFLPLTGFKPGIFTLVLNGSESVKTSKLMITE